MVKEGEYPEYVGPDLVEMDFGDVRIGDTSTLVGDSEGCPGEPGEGAYYYTPILFQVRYRLSRHRLRLSRNLQTFVSIPSLTPVLWFGFYYTAE